MEDFEWDEEKRQSNIRKHNLDFFVASQVFDDPNRLEWSTEYLGEVRTVTIGMIHETIIVICVVWTKRGTKKRIISARKASQNERKKYEG